MQNLSQNDLNEAIEMYNQSQDELNHVAKMRGIKNRKRMSRPVVAERFNSNLNSKVSDIRRIFNRLRDVLPTRSRKKN